ncbi:MAG: TldD/PmbA family protein [Streptosporangiales bacterium]|nr:TldD/PmbA family protein [Streptosporangiales bacterium]MBO0892010.1 TldD/PmbA family protein [Acidothermales bacterium]
MSASRLSPQQAVETALRRSRGDGCVVIADEHSHVDLRWAANSLTTNGFARADRLTVIVTVAGTRGTAVGSVGRSGVTAGQVADLVEAAEHAARDAGPAPDAQPLAVPDDAGSGGPWEEPPARTSPAVFGDLAASLGDAFGASASGGTELFGFAEHELTTTYLGTSTGVRLRHDQPQGRLELNAKSADRARSSWTGLGTTDFADVDVPAATARLATQLGWARRRVELPAGRYETVLPPSAVADLLVYLYWSAGARDAHDGRTVFSRAGGGTRIGERLTSVPVTIRSDPRRPGLACAPFVVAHTSSSEQSVFDNALPSGPVTWVDEGVLSALIQTRYTASLTGQPATFPVDNLVASANGASDDLDALVARTGRGLLLTCLWYIRPVDARTLLLTGLTRDGVYLVEDGEVVGAVNNFRFNESPVGMLSRVLDVGRTERTLARELSDYFPRTAMPALRVADFNMSTVSDAS